MSTFLTDLFPKAPEYSDNPLGPNSTFNTPDGEFGTTGINHELLIYALALYLDNKSTVFFERLNYHYATLQTKDFKWENRVVPLTAKLNTLTGDIDFSQEPYFRFNLNVSGQKATYSLLFPFKKFSDSADYNKFAIILEFETSVDLMIVLSLFKKQLTAESKKNIVDKYKVAFEAAGDNSRVYDFLFETVPTFALEEMGSSIMNYDVLIAKLKVLASERIDTVMTNENVAILNILRVVDKKKFFDFIDNDPSLLRSLFANFSEEYLTDLIVACSDIGRANWKQADLDAANPFHFKIEELDIDGDGVNEHHTGYWCGYIDESRKYEVGYTEHLLEAPSTIVKEYPTTLGFVSPFAPLSTEAGYIPAVAAEKITNDNLNQEKKDRINEALGLAMTEFTLAKMKPFLGLKILKLKVRPSWMPNRVITTKIDETVTLIGGYKADMEAVIQELNVGKNVNFGPKKNGFNYLDVPNELYYLEPEKFFEKFNRPWLKAATDRGDDIVVMSNRYDESLLLRQDGSVTGFKQELDFLDDLVEKGEYRFIKEEGVYRKIKK